MLAIDELDWFDPTTLPQDIGEISTRIRQEGFYCLDGAVKGPFLANLQKNVYDLIDIQGRRYFSIVQPHKKLEGRDDLDIPYKNINNNTEFNALFSGNIINRSKE